ncbi:MAG: hypothetical protein IJ690_04705 [Clostridia bacterium]|nr:hypothetical protein [Clostridia bacterium]
MDKIYSRKRFLIPKLRRSRRSRGIGNIFSNRSWRVKGLNGSIGSGNSGNRKVENNLNSNMEKIISKKTIKTAIIVIIAVFMANRIISTIEPTMDILCRDMAKSIATEVSNEQATVVMR